MSFPTAFHGHVLPRNYRQFEDGDVTAPLSIATQGVIRYNDSITAFQVSKDGGPYVALAEGADAGVIGGNTGVAPINAGATVYAAFGNGFEVGEGNTQFLAPRSGVLRNFFVQVTAGGNTMDDVTVLTLRINGVNTVLILSIPAGSVALFSNVLLTPAVVAGDLISLEVDGTASAIGSIRSLAYGFQLASVSS